MTLDPLQKHRRLLFLLGLVSSALLMTAQTQVPPTPTPTVEPTLTPPTIIVIQATPVPQPTSSANIFTVIWETKRVEIEVTPKCGALQSDGTLILCDPLRTWERLIGSEYAVH